MMTIRVRAAATVSHCRRDADGNLAYGPQSCADFTAEARCAHRGPRGGVRSLPITACVDCGRESTPRPRLNDRDASRAAFEELASHLCLQPRIVTPATALLWQLATLVRAGKPVGLDFALTHCADGDLDAAVRSAWSTCMDGYVMGLFIGSTVPKPRLGWTGDKVHDVHVPLDDAGMAYLNGRLDVVARSMRALLRPRDIWCYWDPQRKFAREASP